MNEAATREHIQRHADAIVRGDMNAVAADFVKELQQQGPELMQALPQPVTEAEVLSVEIGDTESVALIRYSGSGAVTILSRWQDVGGRPTIVHAEPAG